MLFFTFRDRKQNRFWKIQQFKYINKSTLAWHFEA